MVITIYDVETSREGKVQGSDDGNGMLTDLMVLHEHQRIWMGGGA